MKKTMLFGFMSFFAMMTIASCGGNSGNNEGNEIDSVAIEEARIKDSIENAWIKDSLELVKRTTDDLTFFEVHGPVRQIIEYNKYDDIEWFKYSTCEFDQNGKFTLLDGRDPFTREVDEDVYIRDNKGRISEWTAYESSHIYAWKDNRIIGYEWFNDGFYGKSTYIYDDNGLIIKLESVDLGGPIESTGNGKTITSYTYPNIDKYGNWTHRKGGNHEIKREITYYPIERK